MIGHTQKSNSVGTLTGVGIFVVGFLGLSVLCLYQWDSPLPWSRIDLFSGGYLVLATVLVVQQGIFAKRLSLSKEKLEEAFGMNYDPGWIKWAYGLGLAEMLVFIDYGHFRLTPFLEQPSLQAAGIVLLVAANLWLSWVDYYLGRHFQNDLAGRAVLSTGPYRYVRHPRYTGLIATRIAFALALASGVAWALAFCWVMLTLRRIRLEEHHLDSIFGQRYESYADHTPRLVPWLY